MIGSRWALLAALCLLTFAACGGSEEDSGGDDDVADDDDDASDDDIDDDVDDDDDDDVIEPVYGYAVWSQETGPDVLAEWYEYFAERKSELCLEVWEEKVYERDPDIARIFNEAADAGVPVRPYITLPYEDGIYPNEANFDQFFDATKALIQWAEDDGLPIEWVAVDMESPVQMVEQINQYLWSFKIFDLYAFLWSHRDPEAFAQSVANYQALVDYCHDHGFKVHVVSFPFALDDYSDSDFGMQDAFDVPISGVEWDEVGFMVYRTMYMGYAGGMPFTNDLVYRYSYLAREIFGERASIFIGLVLWPGWFEGDLGYKEPAELEADIEAVLAAGISRMQVFYLTGILAKDDPMAWLDPDVSDYQRPAPDQYTTLLIDLAMPLLDSIL